MVVVDGNEFESVREIVEKERRIRKEELDEQIENSHHLNNYLIMLVEEGTARLYPVGDVTIVQTV